jgi:Domain of unknown function (DUF397)
MNLNWRKCSYSGGEGNCVEVADHRNRVLVRDTKDRASAMLRFTPAAWTRFAEKVKRSLAPDPHLGPAIGGALSSVSAPPLSPSAGVPRRRSRSQSRRLRFAICRIRAWSGKPASRIRCRCRKCHLRVGAESQGCHMAPANSIAVRWATRADTSQCALEW